MPRYQWYGTDVTGRLHQGTLFAVNARHLQDKLTTERIALVEAFEARRRYGLRHRFLGQIGFRRLQFIHQLASLLGSGMKIHQAMVLVAETSPDRVIREEAWRIQQALYEGASLQEAVRCQLLLADQPLVALVAAGEKSGKLADVLQRAHAYYQRKDAYKKRLVHALFGPAITGIMFIGVAVGVFTFVIPRFEALFMSMTQELPYSTRLVFRMSRLFKAVSPTILVFCVSALMGVIMLVKRVRQRVVLVVPFYRQWATSRFLHLLGLLTSCHISLISALAVIADVTQQPVLRGEIDTLSTAIACGAPLSQALSQTRFALPGVVHLVRVGESSGNLTYGIDQAARQVSTVLKQRLDRVLTMLHPMMLVLLGAGIAWLLCAIYLPLLTLSSVIE